MSMMYPWLELIHTAVYKKKIRSQNYRIISSDYGKVSREGIGYMAMAGINAGWIWKDLYIRCVATIALRSPSIPTFITTVRIISQACGTCKVNKIINYSY